LLAYGLGQIFKKDRKLTWYNYNKTHIPKEARRKDEEQNGLLVIE
jgi:hypothetical protein